MENHNTVFTLGSRKSTLALIQTNFAKDLLENEQKGNVSCDIITMSTKGDEILDKALSKICEKSLFTKELEIALVDERVDAVVHSLKDLPTILPDGLVIGAVCKRDSPYDAVVMSPAFQGQTLSTLPDDSIVGTSSVRRAAHLKWKYPHLQFKDVRGNLNTRLRKLDESEGFHYAALILAEAGLVRMEWKHRISQVLDGDYYAVGQGAVAIECRLNDMKTLNVVSSVSHLPTLLCCVGERAFMRTLEGGCSVPLGVRSHFDERGNTFKMHGCVYSLDGSKRCVSEVDVDLDHVNGVLGREMRCFSSIYVPSHFVSQNLISTVHETGVRLAQQLLSTGAREILNEIKQ